MQSDKRYLRQVLAYGGYRVNELAGEDLFPAKETQLDDGFVRREIDEAIEKVVELR